MSQSPEGATQAAQQSSCAAPLGLERLIARGIPWAHAHGYVLSPLRGLHSRTIQHHHGRCQNKITPAKMAGVVVPGVGAAEATPTLSVDFTVKRQTARLTQKPRDQVYASTQEGGQQPIPANRLPTVKPLMF